MRIKCHSSRISLPLQGLVMHLCLVATASVAYGDGGFLPPLNYVGRDLTEPAQRAVVVHARTREILHLLVDYHGDADNFAWIIPCPSKPKVRETSKDIFKEVAEYYRHLQMSSWKSPQNGHMGGGIGGGRAPLADDYQVTVHSMKVLGPYEISILSAQRESGLVMWLEENGYFIPRRAEPILKTYIAEEWFFVAVKIRTDPSTIQSLPPLAIEFTTGRPIYPIRISALNSGTTDVRVYFFKTGPRQPRQRKRRDGEPMYAVRSDFASKCPALAKELPEVNWERMELARVSDVLAPQVMSKLDDRLHGASFYTKRTLAKTAGIAEALLSTNRAEADWAEKNLHYYYKLRYRSGKMPEEHAEELSRVAKRLGAPLRSKLLAYTKKANWTYGSSGASVLLSFVPEPTIQ